MTKVGFKNNLDYNECNSAVNLEEGINSENILQNPVIQNCRNNRINLGKQILYSINAHRDGEGKNMDIEERLTSSQAVNILLKAKYLYGAPDCNDINGCRSYDCASLVQWYTKFVTGVDIPGHTKDIPNSLNLTKLNKDDYMTSTKKKLTIGGFTWGSDTHNLQDGDILFFGADYHHVVVYANGEYLSAEGTKEGIVTIPLDSKAKNGISMDYRANNCLAIFRPNK